MPTLPHVTPFFGFLIDISPVVIGVVLVPVDTTIAGLFIGFGVGRLFR